MIPRRTRPQRCRFGTALVATLIAALSLPASAQEAARSPRLAAWLRMERDTTASCRAGEYQGFDFWLGTWRVRGAKGNDAGTSRIEQGPGGCGILEFYGATGRSLSAWRPASREWIQTYVDHSGLTLRLKGRASPDSMQLTDDLRALIGSPSSVVLQSRFVWSRNDDGSVRQVWHLSQDGGLSWNVNFDGAYTRADGDTAGAITTNPGNPAAPCLESRAYRALDHLLGSWDVIGNDGEVVGHSTVTAHLSGCLLEEVYTARTGLSRRSLISYDRYVREWIWASVDASGRAERLVARGTGERDLEFVNEVAGGIGFCLRMSETRLPVVQPSCDKGAPDGEVFKYQARGDR